MKLKRMIFWIFLAAIVSSALCILDIAAGSLSGIQPALSEKNRFVKETAPLFTSTNHLLPNLSDKFINDQESSSLQRSVKTSEYGFIVGPHEPQTSTDTKFILFLGGSTTENNEVDEEFRFPYLAPIRLNKDASTNYVGVNAGVRGHTTQDSINIFLNHPDPRITQSKAVVIMHNINDRLRLRISGDYKARINNPSPLSTEGVIDAIRGTTASTWRWLTTYSNLLALLDLSISKNFGDNREIEVNERVLDALHPLGEEHEQKFRQNYVYLVSLTLANNQTPILMTQPLGSPSKEQDRFNQIIRDVAKKHKVDLIDLAKEVLVHPNIASLFYDDHIHFNNLGSKWAAETIARHLKATFKIASPTTNAPNQNCNDIRANGMSIINRNLNTDILNGRYPSFDPEEQRILFQTNSERGSSIAILETRTGLITTLIKDAKVDAIEHPTWLDSDRIVFTRKSGDSRTLMMYRISDAHQAPLLTNNSATLQAAIANSPNPNTVFFAGYDIKGNRISRSSLYKANIDEGAPVKLTENSHELWRPFLSADGRLFFIAYDNHRYQIAESDGYTFKYLIPSQNEQWDPSISPDGKHLAYSERQNGEFDIWLYDLTSRDIAPRRVTSSLEDEWDSRFSPSGKYLLYAGTSPYGDQIRAICLKN